MNEATRFDVNAKIFAPDVAVIVLAAGDGSRLAHGQPKAFVELAGKTILSRSLEPLWQIAEDVHVVVVVAPDYVESVGRVIHSTFPFAEGKLSVVAGGKSRQASVAAGLAAVAISVETVLVHDSARALTPVSQFENVLREFRSRHTAVIPGVAVADTIKRIDEFDTVVETVDRAKLSSVQTPQAFPRRELDRAYAEAVQEYTDDAALYADHGHVVAVIPGDPLAFKITTHSDLVRAENLVNDSGNRFVALRTGVGVDVHAFSAGRPLWLAGLHWPDERGLAGHSDGDPVAHAICDALLSAANLGDLGTVFGTSDSRFADAHAEVFLTETRFLLEQAGFGINNVSVQIIGAQPRFSPRKAEAEQFLSTLLRAPVSVSATTTDMLGFIGREEGIAAIANALIHPLASSPAALHNKL